MRNWAKYFLAFTVMGTGFYAAQQHRRPEPDHSEEAALLRRPSAETAAPHDRLAPAPPPTDSLPVAALTDVDRVPLLGPDRASKSPSTAWTGAATVAAEPTLRRSEPREETSAVPSSAPQAAKGTKQERAKQERPKQETNKPATEDSPPKRQGTNKTPAAKSSQEDFEPPALAREYQPYTESLEAVEKANSKARDTSQPKNAKSKRAGTSHAASQANKTSTKAGKTSPPRRHCIAEGETLRQLAEKFLGDRERYLDIYNANQDVLFDPQFIPIGVEIVIPRQTVVVAQTPQDESTIDFRHEKDRRDKSDDTDAGHDQDSNPGDGNPGDGDTHVGDADAGGMVEDDTHGRDSADPPADSSRFPEPDRSNSAWEW